MSLYLFDTDLLTLFADGHTTVCERASQHSPDELATSIITVEEQLTGWYTLLRQAKTDQQLVTAYAGMAYSIQFVSRLQIISYSAEAVARVTAFKKARLKIKTMDLRIAGIALHAGAILVTRNRSDFEVVPGLELEDWTIP